MRQERIRLGIITQVAILFIIGAIVTGGFTYFTQSRYTRALIEKETEEKACEVADEAMKVMRQYEASDWLIRYWYEHYQEMEIEYGAKLTPDSLSAKKTSLLMERHPDFLLDYATEEDVMKLSEEDQKLYAEIIYAWLHAAVNRIKQGHDIDYLFCVLSEEPYTDQFFLWSGADEDAVFSSNYEDIYPLGTQVTVSTSQQQAMADAVSESSHLANAGEYVDYYAYYGRIGDHQVLIGMTYNVSDINQNIRVQTEKGAALAIVLQDMLSVLYLIMIYFVVLKPLKSVQSSIRLYEKTKKGEKVRKDLAKIENRNEIGELAEDISEMTKEIDEYVEQIEKITSERERVAAELELAARIQLSSLPNTFPPFPDRKEFDIYALMDPAKEVGGDLYDFFMIDDDHLALLIADVSGKGIPAALTMMMCLILIHNEVKQGNSPAAVLHTVNDELLSRNPEQMFISVWLGVLEISTGKLTAANAGHEYPFIKNPDGKYRIFRDKHGFVLGGMEDLYYKDYELQLSPGSRLFVYTDGLPEASDREGRMFGNDRIAKALNESCNDDVDHTIDHMREAVDQFVGSAEQFDDLTMLCLDYHGPQKE